MLKKIIILISFNFLCVPFIFGSTLSTTTISGKIINFNKKEVTFKQGSKKFTAPRVLFKKRLRTGEFNLKLKNTKLYLIQPKQKLGKKTYKRRSRSISSEK